MQSIEYKVAKHNIPSKGIEESWIFIEQSSSATEICFKSSTKIFSPSKYFVLCKTNLTLKLKSGAKQPY